MRAWLYLCALFAAFTAVLAWTKEDHEIFDLVSELETHEGPGTTFYSLLDVPSNAPQAALSKAYRKLSIKLHPDKNPGVKGAHERYARLGKINTILKTSEGRERYDFFYKNGVPKWRGTGYYYSRFRPGLGAVLSFLTLLTCVLQYFVQRMNYTRDLARVQDLVARAKLAAWGPRLVPIEGSRKVRIPASASSAVEGMAMEKVRTVELVVDGDGSVWHADEQGEQLFDESILVKPTLGNTWAPGLVKSTIAKFTGQKSDSAPEVTQNGVDDTTSASEAEASDAATASGVGKKRKATKRK